uniref:Uncharacterized protein n=1 Tax=Setaria italica TaxID=4555 RepID=K3YEV6_SETIT
MAGAADAEPSHGRRRYVKLGKEEKDGDAPVAGAEDIRPGELNQAVQVWSLFPAGHRPIGVPAPRSLRPSLLSPLISADLCGYVVRVFAIPMQFKVRKCDVCWQELPPGYQLPADEPWATGIFGCAEDPQSCWTGLLCPCVLFGRNAEALDGIPWTRRCACHAVCGGGGTALAILTLTGEHRERKGRLDAQSVAPATIMNPPPVQEMSMVEIGPSASAPESEAPETAHGNAEVEVIPL